MACIAEDNGIHCLCRKPKVGNNLQDLGVDGRILKQLVEIGRRLYPPV